MSGKKFHKKEDMQKKRKKYKHVKIEGGCRKRKGWGGKRNRKAKEKSERTLQGGPA